ncbi:uncharacterized protein [Branchiostoma lanceolatum]|uniref:uncharacterized protein n=1 Tax=Branchiostoma lanceolatum TaxID=7740 RepID=UPI003451124A
MPLGNVRQSQSGVALGLHCTSNSRTWAVFGHFPCGNSAPEVNLGTGETCIPLLKMAGTGGTTLWCIEVTEEQKLTVEALFQHYGWDLVEHPAEPVENRQPQKEPEHVAEDNEGIEVLDQDQEDVTTEGQMPTTSRRQPRRRQSEGIEVLDQDQEDTVPTESQRPTTSRRQPRGRQPESQPTTSTRSSNTECPSCFCDPCVTSRPQRWLGSGNPPGDGNSAVRKTMYKKFWKVLNDRLAWYDPRYLDKKNRLWDAYLAGLDESNCWVPGKHNVTEQSVREIMPDCILHQVRGLYPNKPKVPYMDHKFF